MPQHNRQLYSDLLIKYQYSHLPRWIQYNSYRRSLHGTIKPASKFGPTLCKRCLQRISDARRAFHCVQSRCGRRNGLSPHSHMETAEGERYPTQTDKDVVHTIRIPAAEFPITSPRACPCSGSVTRRASVFPQSIDGGRKNRCPIRIQPEDLNGATKSASEFLHASPSPCLCG